ncbi:MAG: GNAT family N-acetyltransferase [Thermomicrobiales bacterium]
MLNVPSVNPSPQPEIRTLTSEDLDRIRLRRHFRLDIDEVRSILSVNCESSFWIPETDELILVGIWRNRSDLMAIHGLAATANESALIEHAVEHARLRKMVALLMVDAEETRRPVFYAKHGFRTIDKIATYELAAQRQNAQSILRDDLTFVRAAAADAVAKREVEHLDNLAFPWFWWNVRAELDAYLSLPEVEVWIGLQNGAVASYFGITHYRGWGHLDRIATHPDSQRDGIGAATLEAAIRRLRDHGATRIALSTQGENLPAQAMYERRGFERTLALDYTVFGYILNEAQLKPMQVPEREVARGARTRTEREQ